MRMWVWCVWVRDVTVSEGGREWVIEWVSETGRQRDSRVYIRPLAVEIVPRLPRKSGGDQGTPEERQRDARAYIRPPGSEDCPIPATQKRRRPKERQRDARGTPGRTSDPLAVEIVPRLPRKRGVSEWGSEGVSEGGREGVREWVSGWVSEWVSGWMSEWASEWVSERGSEGVSEWVSEWVSQWVSERVSERERTGGGRGRRIQN